MATSAPSPRRCKDAACQTFAIRHVSRCPHFAAEGSRTKDKELAAAAAAKGSRPYAMAGGELTRKAATKTHLYSVVQGSPKLSELEADD